MEMTCATHDFNKLIKTPDSFYLCLECKKFFKKEELKDILSDDQLQEHFGQEDLSWGKKLGQDKDCWYMDAMTDFPYFIANEYKRLYDMLNNGEDYGSLMQLKDVFEVTLKFPLVIILTGCEKKLREISDGYEGGDEERSLLDLIKTDYYEIYSITEMILSKPLSIGEWERIAGLAKKLNPIKDMPREHEQLYTDIIELICKIQEKYRKLHISYWRNKTIGHGALALISNEDKSFEEEYKDKLLGLKWIMEQCADFYQAYGLKTNNSLALKGSHLHIEQLDSLTAFYIYYEYDGDKSIDLTPYFIYEDDKIFIVDAYYSYKNKADMLNYSHGKKISNYKLLERFNNLLNSSLVCKRTWIIFKRYGSAS